LVLLEAQDESSAQARIVMTADEAGELSGKLLRFANKARQGLAGEAKRSPSQVDEEEGLGYPPSLLT
jgi:ABC-type phosphate transport system auxiliary subunit